jgi:hypothetical protein
MKQEDDTAELRHSSQFFKHKDGGKQVTQKEMCNAENEDWNLCLSMVLSVGGTTVKPKANHFTTCMQIHELSALNKGFTI